MADGRSARLRRITVGGGLWAPLASRAANVDSSPVKSPEGPQGESDMPPNRASHFGFRLLGLAAMLFGGAMLLYIYLFASMVDPRLNPAARWFAILEKMFLSREVIGTGLALTLVLEGAVAMVCKPLAAFATESQSARLATVLGLIVLSIAAIFLVFG